MARTSEETLSTSTGRPLALARYISPSNSSRTGQKSFSKAWRLENIAVLPDAEDAVQTSNEWLTKGGRSDPGVLARCNGIRTAQPIRVGDFALPLPWRGRVGSHRQMRDGVG